MSSKVICSECFKKQQEIYRLRQENESLKAKLHYQERKISEGYFGEGTPSSKKPFKSNATPEKQKEKKRGGAKVGHPGHGRHTFDEQQADRVESVSTFDACPDCGEKLKTQDKRERLVMDMAPVKVLKILYKLERKRCPDCKKVFTASVPEVLPKCLYGNNLLAYVATEHYIHGVPLGQLERKLDVGYGVLIKALHKLAFLLKEVPDNLVQDYCKALVKHADETGWRNDGQNGYAWLFATPLISIFRFRKTRSAKVVKEVLGDKPLRGTLVVDRYAAYNKAPCQIQYCYAHLLRDIEKLGKEFPDNKEIETFVKKTAPLMAEAMHLRSLSIDKKTFFTRAANTKAQLIKYMQQEANHPGIQKIQDIFRENNHRLYHWADNRSIPAENNLAERELRPLVIARKISFGSHSDAGAKTREILMSTLLSLKKSKGNVVGELKTFLDKWPQNANKNPYHILFK